MSPSVILGFDPGRQKCGLAVIGADRQPLYHQVVPSSEAIATIQSLCAQYPVSTVVMGDQTSAREWKQALDALDHPTPLPPVVMIDERYSSLEARDRYWQLYPPKGLERLIPQGMRTPPRPIDDIVAIILVERYLAQLD
ncbi:MAG TPA: pre-16S rRNA-processing nuclease YqgF [Chroococcidiopsis sp.]